MAENRGGKLGGSLANIIFLFLNWVKSDCLQRENEVKMSTSVKEIEVL